MPFFTFGVVLLVAAVCTCMLPFETKGKGLRDTLTIEVDESSFIGAGEEENETEDSPMDKIAQKSDNSTDDEYSEKEPVKVVDFETFERKSLNLQ